MRRTRHSYSGLRVRRSVAHPPQLAEPDGEAEGGILQAALRVVADVEEPALGRDGAASCLPGTAGTAVVIPLHRIPGRTSACGLKGKRYILYPMTS